MWVCRDIENKARIVEDGVVKDVDTGGGWGVRPVLFPHLETPFSLHFVGRLRGTGHIARKKRANGEEAGLEGSYLRALLKAERALKAHSRHLWHVAMAELTWTSLDSDTHKVNTGPEV